MSTTPISQTANSTFGDLESPAYYYGMGIRTGMAMAIEIAEGLRPTTSQVIIEALTNKLRDMEKI